MAGLRSGCVIFPDSDEGVHSAATVPLSVPVPEHRDYADASTSGSRGISCTPPLSLAVQDISEHPTGSLYLTAIWPMIASTRKEQELSTLTLEHRTRKPLWRVYLVWPELLLCIDASAALQKVDWQTALRPVTIRQMQGAVLPYTGADFLIDEKKVKTVS